MRRSRVISPSLASASAIAAPTLSQLHRLGLRLKQGHTRSQSRSRSRSRKHSLNFLGLIVLVSAIGSLFPVVLGKCGEGKLKISLHKPWRYDKIILHFEVLYTINKVPSAPFNNIWFDYNLCSKVSYSMTIQWNNIKFIADFQLYCEFMKRSLHIEREK